MYDLLNQTAKIYKQSTVMDAYGKRSWLASDTVDCRFVKTTKIYKSNTGKELNIVCKFQIADRSVDVGTKIEFESKFYIVELIKDWRSESDYFGCLAYCSNMPYA